jgi:hypothetical protein
MSEIYPALPILDQTATYEIRLTGHLPERWAGWFGDVAIGLEADGTTRLTCPAMDQAALHGLLRKVRDVGLPLVSVNRVAESNSFTKGA